MKYLKWFLRTVRPYWGSLSVMMSCHVLLTACSIGFVYVSKKLVDTAVALLSGAEPSQGLSFWALLMVSIILFRIVLNALRSYLQTKTEISMKNSLRKRLFDILLHLQNDGGTRHHSGDVLNRLQDDVRVVSNAFAVSLPNLLGTALHFLAALIFLMTLEPRLGLLIVIIAPAGLIIGKFVTRRIRNLTHDIRKTSSQVQSHLQESVQNITLILSMEYSGNSASTLDSIQGELYGNEIRRTRFSVVSRIFISLAFQAGHAVAFLWGVWGISTGKVTYGMMTAFLQLVGQIQRPLADMSGQIPSLIHASASIDRLMELEALPAEEPAEPHLLHGNVGIKLENVSFAYPDNPTDVLHDFSYEFKPGSRTAIVGPTGIGKSTMIRLLLALLKPREGKISLYDSLSEVPVSPATRINLVYVPQGNSLFSGTVRDNLLMGNPEATQQQLENALRTAAADFVFSLPSGLDTQCFEAGAGLSEGQAQRIAIARALLRPGSVLLLDEFSSALDAETETLLLERLTKELHGHTMVFITHRDKIIDYCDSVLRLA
ncbi:MAG: ABC transporter ATP-binding protein [Bacteroidales bacterium]|nr:ABC transporter ATP-binding protein [Bacteroidales bacterium]